MKFKVKVLETHCSSVGGEGQSGNKHLLRRDLWVHSRQTLGLQMPRESSLELVSSPRHSPCLTCSALSLESRVPLPTALPPAWASFREPSRCLAFWNLEAVPKIFSNPSQGPTCDSKPLFLQSAVSGVFLIPDRLQSIRCRGPSYSWVSWKVYILSSKPHFSFLPSTSCEWW